MTTPAPKRTLKKIALPLRRGARGADVCVLQRALSAQGRPLQPDGAFGPATERAVRGFQHSRGLIADGIVGARTLAALLGRSTPGALSQGDIVAAAHTLGVRVAAIQAVTEVESAGRGFTGRHPTVLFERHVMYRRLTKAGRPAHALSVRYPHLVNTTPGGYKGGRAEWRRFEKAADIDLVCAIEATSWGRFQIMGLHWQRLGYDCAQDYMEHMEHSETDQLDAFVRFVRSDRTLHQALIELRWNDFALIYNGPNYHENDYAYRLRRAYRRHAEAD